MIGPANDSADNVTNNSTHETMLQNIVWHDGLDIVNPPNLVPLARGPPMRHAGSALAIQRLPNFGRPFIEK
jgi:hypothetical protein